MEFIYSHHYRSGQLWVKDRNTHQTLALVSELNGEPKVQYYLPIGEDITALSEFTISAIAQVRPFYRRLAA